MSSDREAPQKVVVCGGGVIGVCSAYFLSKRGCDVTIVEQSGIACAASGKAGGFLARDWCSGPVENLARLSFDLHSDLGDRLGDKYEFRRVTTLSVTVDQSDGKSTLKKKVAKNLPDWIDGSVSRPSEIGGPSNTAQVNPKLFTETLLEEARLQHGVKVKIGRVSAVETEISEGTGGALSVSHVVVGEERMPVDVVVFALGPWTNQLRVLSDVIKVSGLKANSLILKPVGEKNTISAHMLFTTFRSKTGKVTDPEVYPRPSGLVYACGMSSDGDPPRDPADIHVDPAAIPYLRDVAASVSSQLKGAEVVAAQACYLPCSEDGSPVIGAIPRLQGGYVATGHSCWGILNAPGTGLLLSELVVDGKTKSADISALSPARFARTSQMK